MKNPIVLALLSICLASCENLHPPPTVAGTTGERPSVARERQAKASRKAPRVIAVVKDTGFKEPIVGRGTSLTASTSVQNDGVTFAGTARKAAKISIVTATPETENLSQLIAWCRAHDSEMRNHQPPISKAASSTRIPEENRNVSVDAWVHFAKKETDNDYHLIIGTSENADDSDFMNAEISGLPPHNSRSFSTLENARNSFENTFNLALPKMQQTGYAKLTPTHVLITGSLFYDIDHPAGAVGPTGYRAKSAWEIHPITSIVLSGQ